MAIRSMRSSTSTRPMKTGNTRWLNNAMKSLGMASTAALKEIAPNISETVTTGMDVSRSIAKSIRTNKQGAQQLHNSLNNNKYVKLMGTAVKNSITDIKKGTFYVQADRLLGEEEDEWSGGGMTFGDDGAETSIINVGDGGATVKAVDGLSKQLSVNAAASIKMQKASMDAYIATSAAGMQQVGEIGTQIINQLNNVNSNLAALVEYQNNNMSKFIDASMAYFEKTGPSKEAEKASSKVSAANVLNGSSGGLNMGNYKNYVKQQIKDMADSSSAGILLNLLNDDDMLKMVASNPLGFMTQGLVKYAMPKIFTTSIQAMEASFSNVIPQVLTEIGRWADQEGVGFAGKVKQTIGKAFGVKEERVKNIAKDAKIEYGAIPFDGETKHAITHIITKELSLQTNYLEIIASHYNKNAKNLAEKNRQIWDKRSNTYVTKEGVDKSIANAITEAIQDGFNGTRFGKQMSSFVYSSSDNKQSQASMQRLVNELYTNISRSNDKLSPETIIEMIAQCGGSKQEQDALSAFIKKMAENDKIAFNSVDTGRIISRSNSNEKKKEIRDNPLDYHLFDSVYGNPYDDADDITDRVLAHKAYYQKLAAKNGIKNSEKKYKRDRKKWGERQVSAKKTIDQNVGLDETLESYQLSNLDFSNLNLNDLKDNMKTMAGQVGVTVNKILHGATATEILGDVAKGAKDLGVAFVEKHSDVFDEVKQNFVNMGASIKKGLQAKFFGDPDNPKDVGIFGKIGNTLTEGAKGWADALFGPEEDREKDNETILADFMAKAKENLPANITGALIGSGVSLAASGSLLGAMIGGPIGGAVLGVAGSILSRNDKFQNWLFGEKDDEGNRLGGFISKKTQDWAKEHKNSLIGGASFGAISGTITGGGILGTLVGGPIAGALMGMATTTLFKSQAFHDFVFGNAENGQKGFAQGIKDAFSKHFKPKGKSEDDIAKSIGMSILGAGAGGILGAAFGGPVLGAVAGLGLSIKAQSGNFKEWLFGKEEEGPNGEKRKKEGVVGQIGNILNANLLMPLKTNLEFLAKDAILTVEEHVLTPIKFGAELVASKAGEIVSDIKDKVGGIFSNVGEGVKNFLSDTFGPLTKAAGEAISGVTSFAYNTAKAVVTAPFKLMGKAIDFATSKVAVVADAVIGTITNAIGTVKDAALGVVHRVGRLLLHGVGGIFKVITSPITAALGIGGRALKGAGKWINEKLGGGIVKYSGGDTFRDRWNAAKGVNKERRQEMLKDRQNARKHNENAKYIAKYTKGQYSVDSDEAREYLKQINYRAWKSRFGGDKAKDNNSVDDDARQREQERTGFSTHGMSDNQLANADPSKLSDTGRLVQLVKGLAEDVGLIRKAETEDEGNFNKNRNQADSEREKAKAEEDEWKNQTFADKQKKRKENMQRCNRFIRIATEGGFSEYSTKAVKWIQKNKPDYYKLYEKYARNHRWPANSKQIKIDLEKLHKEQAQSGEDVGAFDDLSEYIKDQHQKLNNFLFGDKSSSDQYKSSNLGDRIKNSVNEEGSESVFEWVGNSFNKNKIKSRWGNFKNKIRDHWAGEFAEGGTPTKEGIALVGEKGPELAVVDKNTHIASSQDTAKAITNIQANRDKLKQAQEDALTAKEQREAREKAEEKKEDKKYKKNILTNFKEVVHHQKESFLQFAASFGKKSLFAIGAGLITKFLLKHPNVLGTIGNIAGGIGKAIGTVATFVGDAIGKVAGVITDIWNSEFVQETLIPGAKKVAEFAWDKLTDAADFIGQLYEKLADHFGWSKEHDALTNGEDSGEILKDNIDQIKDGHLLTDKKGNLNQQSGARAKLLAKLPTHRVNKRIKKTRKWAKKYAKKHGLDYNTWFDDVKDSKNFIKNKLSKKGTKEVLEDGAQGWLELAESTGDDVVSTVASKAEKKASKKAAKKAAKDAAKKVVVEGSDDALKAGAELAEKGSKGLLKKALSWFDDAIKFITKAAGDLVERFGKSKAGDITSKIFKKLKPDKAKGILEKYFPKVSAKIEAIAGGKGAAVAATAGLADAAFVVIGALNGLTGAKKLFHVDEVDEKMIAIAGIWGGLSGTMVGSILDVINGLIFDVLGVDFISIVSTGIYSLFSSDEAVKALEKSQEEFKAKYDEYQEKSLKDQWKTQIEAGIIDKSVTFEEFKESIHNNDGKYKASYKSFADYNDDEHASFLGKVGKKLGKAGKAIGKAVVGTETLTDSNGNTYTKNADGDYDVKNKNGKRIGTIAKDAIPEDAVKDRSGGIVGAVKTAAKGYGNMVFGKKTYTDKDGNIYREKANGTYDVTDDNGKSLGNMTKGEIPSDLIEKGKTGGLFGIAKAGLGKLADTKLGQKLVDAGKSVLGISDKQLANTDPSKLDPSSRSAYYLHAIFEKLTGQTDTTTGRNSSVMNSLITAIGATNPIISTGRTLIRGASSLLHRNSTSGGSGEGSYFSQNDSRWANKYYGSDGATMKDSGCGPAAVAMAVNDARQKEFVDPTDMAQLATATGDRDSTGTNWNFIGKASSVMGLNSSQTYNPSAMDIYSQVNSGNPVILSGSSNNSGPYTAAGHYVVADGTDSKGNIRVKDPRGKGFSRAYNPVTLANHTGSSWMIGGHGKKKSGVATTEEKKGKEALKRSQDRKNLSSAEAITSTDDYQRWLDIVKEAKRQIGEQKLGYYNHNGHKSVTVKIGDKSATARTDCSGFVDICLQLYGVLKSGTGLYTGMMKKDSSTMQGTGFTCIDWPGWDKLIPGDIVVNTATHTEIFSRNDGGSHYVYNCGSNDSCNSTGETTSGHSSYELVWRPGAAGSGAASVDGTDGSLASSGETSLLGKIGGAISGVASAVFNRLLTGDTSNTDYSAIIKNAFSGGTTTSDSSTTGAMSADNLVGGDTAQKVWNYFTGIGYSKAATAGILGNLYQESGVNPAAIQGNGKGPAAGIAQWENYNTKSSRWKELDNYAKSKGKDWTDLGSQLEFMDKELKGLGSFWNYQSNMTKAGTTGTSYDQWKDSTDIETATRQFEGAFERAGIPMMEKRVSAAKGYYNKFANGGSGYGGFGEQTLSAPNYSHTYSTISSKPKNTGSTVGEYYNNKKTATTTSVNSFFGNVMSKASTNLVNRSNPTYGGKRIAESERAKGLARLSNNAGSGSISSGGYYTGGSYSGGSSGGADLSEAIKYFKKMVKLLDKIEGHTGSSSKYLKKMKPSSGTNILLADGTSSPLDKSNPQNMKDLLNDTVNNDDKSGFAAADLIARGNY